MAGCMVNEGKFVKDCGIKVIRKGKTVHVGVLDSLKRVRENVKEVNIFLPPTSILHANVDFSTCLLCQYQFRFVCIVLGGCWIRMWYWYG